MVPKKLYDDALRLIEDLKKQIAALKTQMEKMVERHVYDSVVIELEKLRQLHSHLGNEKSKTCSAYEDLLNQIALLKQQHAKELLHKDEVHDQLIAAD